MVKPTRSRPARKPAVSAPRKATPPARKAAPARQAASPGPAPAPAPSRPAARAGKAAPPTAAPRKAPTPTVNLVPRPARRAAAARGRAALASMTAPLEPTGAERVATLRDAGVNVAKIGGFDVDGVLRGKYVSLDKLAGVLDEGFGFCDVVFGWDVNDALYDNARVTGWHTGYPDAHAVLDPTTERRIPWEPGTVAMIADFRDGQGGDHPACGRSALKRVLARLEKHGFTAKVGTEFEFFLFQETRETVAEKHFRGLQPLDPGMFGYSWLRAGQDSVLMHALLEELGAFDIRVEGLHAETGPGVYEAALRYDDALAAADQAALFKTAVKEICAAHGITATFMAKWNAALPGCSGHLHQSLWRDGQPAFLDPRARHGMSKVMRQFIAGQLALMPELTAVYSPTINSYKRYVPGVWAPLVASWGVENRTCTVRVVGCGTPAQRVEYRQTAADMNPYLATAASLGAGLWGIEQGLELPDETRGDAGADGPGRVPATLREATARLAGSAAAREILGEATVDHYVRTRDWECRQYEKAVTDWELARYFEII